MTYTVFFREVKQIFNADDFISKQPLAHHALLKTIVDELASRGTITHSQASRNSKGEWTILMNDNGDVYAYTLFISTLQTDEINSPLKSEIPERKSTLVIIDPSGPRDSIGGYHPGYWFVAQYVNLLEENQKALFKEIVDQIENNILSDNYSMNSDGSIAIHAQKKTKTFNTSLTCRAQWV